MKSQSKNTHAINLAIAIGIGVLFTLFSTVLIVRKLRKSNDQISGTVISVQKQKISILDRTNHNITLYIDDQTRFHDGGPEKISDIKTGSFLYSFGKRIDQTTFLSKGIRILMIK